MGKNDKVNKKNGVTLKAYRGDAMTLLAFDIEDSLMKENFVGFSIEICTPSESRYFLLNRVNFEGSKEEKPSDVAPFQKFRWIHVPGVHHQKLNEPEYGKYKYYVTPRYLDENGKLGDLDDALTVDLEILVDRFDSESVELAFTRSFLTSQAYVHWFGENNNFIKDGTDWFFKTSQHFCSNDGNDYTYEDVYTWLGFTARRKIINILKEVLDDGSLSVDMFAYDFNEPVIADLCLQLAGQGKIRIILDNSTSTKDGVKTGHGTEDSPESYFEGMFSEAAKEDSKIMRGRFKRYAHNKVIIVKKDGNAVKVLTGSTNFSVTGLCVNANHVAVFNDKKVASCYEKAFEASWGDMRHFSECECATECFEFNGGATSITFAPHDDAFATSILDGISERIGKKSTKSVLFSIMSLAENSGGSVYPALREIHTREDVFSYGVTDSTKSVSLYKPGSKRGILVNAKSLAGTLPPPFDREESVKAHNIHHKFVVVDFNTPDNCVYFGSSNLALGGEESNGDNLICIKDEDIATVFAIEAVRLMDHFHFRAKTTDKEGNEKPFALKKTSVWAKPYFNENDIKYIDRKLFVS